MDSYLMRIGFVYTATLRDVDGTILSRASAKNIIPLQGRNHILSSAIGGGLQVPTWYIGIFGNNYVPTDSDVIATFPSAATEITAYVETSRRTMAVNAANAGVIDTVGKEVVFTLSADAMVYGGFIASSQGKAATTGILLSAAKFATPQQGYSGQTVTIGAVCTLVNV